MCVCASFSVYVCVCVFFQCVCVRFGVYVYVCA